MSTLQAHDSPEARIKAGAAVISAATTLSPTQKKAVASHYALFLAAHKSYVAAQSKVAAADVAIAKQHEKIHVARENVDVRIIDLANALSEAGQPRHRPFAAFKVASPSDLAHEGLTREVKDIHTLTKGVLAWKAATPKARSAATALDKSALALAAVPSPEGPLTQARDAAIVVRESLGKPWDLTFKVLKSSARIADGLTASGTFAALFQTETPASTVAQSQQRAAAAAKKATTTAARAKKLADTKAAKVAKKSAKVAAKKAKRKKKTA